MEKFLAGLLTVVIVFHLVGWVLRRVGPWLLRRVIGNAFSDTVTGDFATEPEETPTRNKTGGLKPRVREGQRMSDVLGGEYVDYEDVNQ